jgi:hypothetical protein
MRYGRVNEDKESAGTCEESALMAYCHGIHLEALRKTTKHVRIAGMRPLFGT